MSVATDDRQELGKLIHGIQIPPQPEILAEIDKELQQADSDLPRVAHLIRSDVSLSAGILKVVNSAQFGLRTQVGSVHQAVALLGLNCLRNMLSAVALKRSMVAYRMPALPRYWDSAAAIASAAMEIARRVTRIPPDEAYTLGLFCDAGIPLLAGRFPDYIETLKSANVREGGRFTDLEEEHYQTNHAVVGFYMAASWHLSPANQEAIGNHHNVDDFLGKNIPGGRELETRLAVLKLAEHAEHLCNRPHQHDPEWAQLGSQIIDYLGLSEPDFMELMADLLEQLKMQ
jgi:HD-like signal output (HDOD) protein